MEWDSSLQEEYESNTRRKLKHEDSSNEPGCGVSCVVLTQPGIRAGGTQKTMLPLVSNLKINPIK